MRYVFLSWIIQLSTCRHSACEAEIEVNRPLAPEIYRRVVPITREGDGRLALDGAGTPGRVGGRDAPVRRKQDIGPAGREQTRSTSHWPTHSAARWQLLNSGARVVHPAPWIDALAGYIEEHVATFGARPELFAPAEIEALARASRATRRGFGRC